MDRYYDLAEDPHFWDALDELEGDPDVIGELVGTIVQWALEDPYRAKELSGPVRVMTSLPVVRGGIIYAFRLAYMVTEYVMPRDGKHGLVLLLHVRACDSDDLLGDGPGTARDRHH